MSQLRLLFDAMDADGLLALYVTAATCFTVIALVQLAQLAWHYLEPHVFLLLNFRKESDVACYSDPARPRVVQKAAHVTRPQRLDDRSSMGRRLASARDQKQAAFHRPLWLADAADRHQNAAGRGTGTQVGVMPKDAK